MRRKRGFVQDAVLPWIMWEAHFAQNVVLNYSRGVEMNCLKCDRDNSPDAKFCRACGDNLDEQRKAALQEKERLAQERKKRIQLRRDRFFGTKRRKLLTVTTSLLVVAACAGLYLFVTAPPPRPPTRILWSGSPEVNCFKFECLREQMQKSGANPEAIAFAERLSSSESEPGRPAAWWAYRVDNYGHVDIVGWYGAEETSGFVFLDRNLKIILPDSFVEADLHTFGAFMAQHPQAFGIGFGGAFVGKSGFSDGRMEFTMRYPIGICEACAPLAALSLKFVFDKAGHYLGQDTATLTPWAG